MSANERTETVFECIRGGAEDYLLKPVTKKEVQHMWQHVWRRQQQNALRVPHLCPEEVSPLLCQVCLHHRVMLEGPCHGGIEYDMSAIGYRPIKAKQDLQIKALETYGGPQNICCGQV